MTRLPILLLVTMSLLPGCDRFWERYQRLRDAGVCNANLVCYHGAEVEQNFSFQRPMVDALFVIKNSPYMREKQYRLASASGAFFDPLAQWDADLHVGVVTTDVGSLPQGQVISPYGTCNSVEGDDGRLQRKTCRARTWQNQVEGDTACQQTCVGASFAIQDDRPYIAVAGPVSNVPVAPDGGRDIGPQRAFRCLALVGDTGCAIEGPLEAARRALDGHLTDNAGFLRPGSMLGLFLLSDEDDCSVAATRRAENDATVLDCPTADAAADWRCFNPDFRCLARALTCDDALNVAGTKTGCQQMTPSYLEPTATYADFFKALRPDGRIVVTGLWAPKLDGVTAKLVVTAYKAMPKSYELNRGTLPGDAACTAPGASPSIQGLAQLRLSDFAGKLPGSIEASICQPENYGQALSQAARQLLLGSASCLRQAPKEVLGQESCLVGDAEVSDLGQAPPERYFPLCGAGCCAAWAGAGVPLQSDPGIVAACQGEGQTCYCAVKSTQGACPGGAVAGLVRRGPVPENTVVNFRCAIERD